MEVCEKNFEQFSDHIKNGSLHMSGIRFLCEFVAITLHFTLPELFKTV